MKTIFIFILLGLLILAGCQGQGNDTSKTTPAPTENKGSIKSLDTGRKTAVETSLKQDPELVTCNITVEAFNYTITLSGKVDTEEQKMRAEKIASSVSGVQKVINKLEVSP